MYSDISKNNKKKRLTLAPNCKLFDISALPRTTPVQQEREEQSNVAAWNKNKLLLMTLKEIIKKNCYNDFWWFWALTTNIADLIHSIADGFPHYYTKILTLLCKITQNFQTSNSKKCYLESASIFNFSWEFRNWILKLW